VPWSKIELLAKVTLESKGGWGAGWVGLGESVLWGWSVEGEEEGLVVGVRLAELRAAARGHRGAGMLVGGREGI